MVAHFLYTLFEQKRLKLYTYLLTVLLNERQLFVEVTCFN